MRRRHPLVTALAVGALGLALGAPGALGTFAQEASPEATPAGAIEVGLTDAAGAEAGTATFQEGGDGVALSIRVEGLAPGEHGWHLHAIGMCQPGSAEPFSSAGPHWNPTAAPHGGPDDEQAHAGDFGNLTAGDDGVAEFELTTDRFTLGGGPTSVADEDGTAIIVHLGQDDLESQPAGDSGGRYACGVVAEPMSPPAAAGAPTPESTIEGNVLTPEQMPFSEELLAGLQVPDGFEVSVVAQGLTNPRMMAVGPDGTIYVTQPAANTVSALRDGDGDGVAEESAVVASNLPYVHGITILDEQVYLAGEKQVWRADLAADGTLGEPEVLMEGLPDGDQHGRRTIAFGPDGMLYVSLGSSCNACNETNRENATIVRANPDGSGREIFASGLRNTIGWGWHPESGDLWGMDHGSDWRGNDQPPEELNLIVAGANYGWPFCFGEQEVDPNISGPPPGATPDQYCANSEAAALLYQAHSAPIGLAFYSADQFPAGYQGDAFVAMRGSWNRFPATGYKLVRVDFENGQPVAIEDFVTGWLIEDGGAHFGRIAGVTVAPDGSLLVSEDTNGVIYRVSYAG